MVEFHFILFEIIKASVYETLRENQAVFRKGCSCIDQIAALTIIIEQSEKWNSPFLMNFIDYEKALGSVDRSTLWKLMHNYGIPEKLVNQVKASYEGTTSRVVHDGQLSDRFRITTEVRQGCFLSPFLFNLAIDWMMKETTKGRQNGIQWTPWLQLDDLDFADNLLLLCHATRQKQDKTDDLNNTSMKVNLGINSVKSKVMKNKQSNTDRYQP